MNHILNRKFWIFDLDGTLTKPVHDFPAIRDSLGIPAGADILKFIESQDKSAAKAMLEKLDLIEIDLAENSEPAEGVAELISILTGNNVRMGIITRNTKENARLSLEKIGILSFFEDETILGRTQAPPKPDPTAILHLLSYWNATPDQAVMVGDYLFDLETGKTAGTATIHVSQNEEATWPDLTDIHATSLLKIVRMFTWQNDLTLYEN